MAFMRMMGVDSVAYHQATVLDRADDHPGLALDYYASRGETPLVWGGRGAARLGLAGAVTAESYAAMFGPGGAVDPVLGRRLTVTKRPGMELVVAAHKSVAELGVIGRPEDMHRILDAETRATLEYLERCTLDAGGRRGRAAHTTATSGMTYAVSRHATTRAGDPGPHDHVLIVNAVEMLDARGGWKAPNTTLWRDELHAATVYGRLHAAWEARRLGYAIRADDGRSGRLGHWAIDGIPQAVLDLHSKRAAEIDEHIGVDASHRARTIAARETRAYKRHTPVTDLVPRWRGELADAGYPAADLWASIDERARHAPERAPRLSPVELDQLVRETLAMDGPLADRKVFTRREIIVALAPRLYGHHPGELHRALGAVLEHPELVRLLPTDGALLPAFSLATVLATEHAIADNLTRAITRHDAPALEPDTIGHAITVAEARVGRALTPGQHAAVEGVCGSDAGAALIVGVAGSGKTTALAAIGAGYTDAGYTVVGAATAGQAAQTLEATTGIESRTIASLLSRIETGQITLTPRHVVIVDEAGMTDDPDLLAVLTRARIAHTKTVLVGDNRQLSPVGPGGALGALIDRWPQDVHYLRDNVRHHTAGEPAALDQLRDGDPAQAIAWMATHHRIIAIPDRRDLLHAAVNAWTGDVDAGRETILLAWRRDTVETLNHLARHTRHATGALHGPTVTVEDGTEYQTGDRVLALHPAAGGQLLTSQRGTVVAVDVENHALIVEPDGTNRHVRLDGDDLAPQRLTYGYATTVHRAQGLTVDTAHVLEDGGGRELAYVKTSRARHDTHLYVQADDLDQATEDLTSAWASERRKLWAIDTHHPSTAPNSANDHVEVVAAMRRLELDAEARAIRALRPDISDLQAAILREQHLRHALDQLPHGRGPAATPEIADTAHALETATRHQHQLERLLDHGGLRRRERRQASHELDELHHDVPELADRLHALTQPIEIELQHQLADAHNAVEDLAARRRDTTAWLDQHPEIGRRLDAIDRELDHLHRGITIDPPHVDRAIDTAFGPRRPDPADGLSIEL